MERKAPSPVCKSLLFCQQLIQDKRTKFPTLVNVVPFVGVHSFPVIIGGAVFSRWTSANGEYLVDLQLLDEEESIIWSTTLPEPLIISDPLKTCDIFFHDLKLAFSKPGIFQLVIRANGEEIGRDSLTVSLVRPGPPKEVR